MSSKFHQGTFQPKNPDKFVGNKLPRYRSDWERVFMNFCDNNPSIQQWSSESVIIPYRDPLTGKSTIYVPDFLIVYLDKNLKKHIELIEIKPVNQTVQERVGKSAFNQAQYIKNMAKWTAAQAYCQQHGIKFRVITENEIFGNSKR